MITWKNIIQQRHLPVQIGKRQHSPLHSSQSGFTIIESLIAILVVGILMTMITPVIVLSVATRVQARRVELASQAARTYIDGIKSGVILTPLHAVVLDEVNEATTPPTFTPQRGTFSGIAAPTSSGSLTCLTTTTGYPYCPNTAASSLYCNDLDGGGCTTSSTKDLLVQAIRTSNAQNYILSLRVYRADAFSDNTTLRTQKQVGSKQSTFTGGLGNRKAPVVEMTTEISTQNAKFGDLCDRLGGC